MMPMPMRYAAQAPRMPEPRLVSCVLRPAALAANGPQPRNCRQCSGLGGRLAALLACPPGTGDLSAR